MFVSDVEVAALTPYTVTLEEIAHAQAIIEVYVGRTEVDVDDPSDLAMLARATAYQAAYMQEHGKMIFEQIDLKSITVGGTNYNFHTGDHNSPFIAPLAQKACKNLSWMKSRGVRTGRIPHPRPALLSWWTH